MKITQKLCRDLSRAVTNAVRRGESPYQILRDTLLSIRKAKPVMSLSEKRDRAILRASDRIGSVDPLTVAQETRKDERVKALARRAGKHPLDFVSLVIVKEVLRDRSRATPGTKGHRLG